MELQLNNLTVSILRLLRREIDQALQPLAARYGITLSASAVALQDGDAKFSVTVEGAVQSDE